MSIEQLRCYDPDSPYLAQETYPTPDGFVDEEYVIPFTFELPTDGSVAANLPVQMDDDVPFFLRSVVWPAAGLTIPVMASYPESGIPAFIAVRDTRGNRLTDGLVLTWGAICQSGFGNNGAGFPLDVEVECDPGGCLLFDIQVPVLAGTGFASLTGFGIAESITFTAKTAGSAGNAISILVNEGVGNNQPLVISVSGEQISIITGTNSSGLSNVTTFADVLAGIAASGPASALITASLAGPNPLEIFPPSMFGENAPHLSGGGGALSTSGNLVGVKRYPKCVAPEVASK